MLSLLAKTRTNLLPSQFRHLSALPSSPPSLPPPTPITTPTQPEQHKRLYFGDTKIPLTSHLKIYPPSETPPGLWPVFRVLNEDGGLRSATSDAYITDNIDDHDYIEGAYGLKLTESTALNYYRTMIRLRTMDTIFMNAQRQGRISFYMTSTGEESSHIGSAAALDLDDVIFAQYRETGVLLYRGFSSVQFADQCFSNAADLGKGRQMPVHYGSKKLNFHTISSPLTTQVPQAAGCAYALKVKGEREGSGRAGGVTVCYFGDGAASEGDFTSGLNIASTLDCPVIFFCRNNGFAISTPTDEQYKGDGIVSRGPGYGIHSVRVDGNDLLACKAVMVEAKEFALKMNRPVLVEAMSYRVGHHSTSDDSTRYRNGDEIERWMDEDDPIQRFKLYLEKKGWIDEEMVERIMKEERKEVLKALQSAEKKAPPPLSTMFEDVYKDKTPILIKQEKELLEHLKKYPAEYDLTGL